MSLKDNLLAIQTKINLLGPAFSAYKVQSLGTIDTLIYLLDNPEFAKRHAGGYCDTPYLSIYLGGSTVHTVVLYIESIATQFFLGYEKCEQLDQENGKNQLRTFLSWIAGWGCVAANTRNAQDYVESLANPTPTFGNAIVNLKESLEEKSQTHFKIVAKLINDLFDAPFRKDAGKHAFQKTDGRFDFKDDNKKAIYTFLTTVTLDDPTLDFLDALKQVQEHKKSIFLEYLLGTAEFIKNLNPANRQRDYDLFIEENFLHLLKITLEKNLDISLLAALFSRTSPETQLIIVTAMRGTQNQDWIRATNSLPAIAAVLNNKIRESKRLEIESQLRQVRVRKLPPEIFTALYQDYAKLVEEKLFAAMVRETHALAYVAKNPAALAGLADLIIEKKIAPDDINDDTNDLEVIVALKQKSQQPAHTLFYTNRLIQNITDPQEDKVFSEKISFVAGKLNKDDLTEVGIALQRVAPERATLALELLTPTTRATLTRGLATRLQAQEFKSILAAKPLTHVRKIVGTSEIHALNTDPAKIVTEQHLRELENYLDKTRNNLVRFQAGMACMHIMTDENLSAYDKTQKLKTIRDETLEDHAANKCCFFPTRSRLARIINNYLQDLLNVTPQAFMPPRPNLN